MQTILLPEQGKQSGRLIPCRALHRLRTRQETSELRYWLFLSAYDLQDKSLSNKLYLVYLLVFYGFLTLVGLAFFAQGASKSFLIMGISQPAPALAAAASICIGMAALVQIWQAIQSSPLRFSEADRYQLCLQPLPKAFLILRWTWLTCIKTLLPLLLIFIFLGFSYAESLYPGLEFAAQFPAFFLAGLRMAIALIPWHLFFFLLSWVFGLLAQSTSRPSLLLLPGLLMVLLFLLPDLLSFFPASGPPRLWALASDLPRLSAFFRLDLPWQPAILLWPTLLALLAVLLLCVFAPGFDPLKAAAQSALETSVAELRRYGFNSVADSLQARQRMGIARNAQFHPSAPGSMAFLNKAWLSYKRSFNFSRFWELFQSALLLLALFITPGVWTKLLLLIVWTYDYTQFALSRFRADLLQYYLLRLTPLPVYHIALADLAIPYLLSLLSAWALTIPLVFAGMAPWPILLHLPLILATVSLSSAAVMLKKADPAALLSGTVPNPALTATLLAWALNAIPFLLGSALPFQSRAGTILASAVLSLLSYRMLIAASKAH